MAVMAACAVLSSHTPGSSVRAAGDGDTDTGTIDGTVAVVAKSSRRLASAGAYPSRTIGLPGGHDASELANVVVFVKTPPTAVKPMRAAIRQVDEEFVPHLVAVTTGSTVEFPNEDLIFHNVFSLSRAASFDLGRYPRGSARSRVFSKAGLVKVFCQLHSHMSAMIRLFDHPFFAVPSGDGRFSLTGLAPGAYEVVAWHERVGEVTRRATVVAGQTTPLTFSLPLTDVQ